MTNLQSESYEPTQDYAQYFKLSLYQLPENIWILGKPIGTVFKINNGWSVKFQIATSDNIQQNCVKAFSGENEKSRQDANDWLINSARDIGVTKNLIMVQGDTILVQLTKNQVMITDKVLLPLVQMFTLCSTMTNDKDPNCDTYYAGGTLNNHRMKFHRLITGYSTVDHINLNQIDNRLENLRPVDRAFNKSNMLALGEILGVYPIESDGYTVGYMANYCYQQKHLVRKFLVTKDYSIEQAKADAVEYRRKIFELHLGEFETLSARIEVKYKDLEFIRLMITRFKDLLTLLEHDYIKTVEDYLPGVEIAVEVKQPMFDHYIKVQDQHRLCLNNKIKQLEKDFDLATAKLSYNSAEIYAND